MFLSGCKRFTIMGIDQQEGSGRALKAAAAVKGKRRTDLWRNKSLYAMLMPGIAFLVVFNYLPMIGIIIPFKNITYSTDFFSTLFGSEWIGLRNFSFFFESPDAVRIVRNTVLYNAVFIILGLIFPVSLAIMLHELLNRRLAKLYQTVLFMPYFLSWVVVGYLVYAFISQTGYINSAILGWFGMEPIEFYMESKYWPYILTFMNVWKYTGYGIIVYLAALAGIDDSYYEAAAIDGATKLQQIRMITIPLLTPMMMIMTILAVGRIFSGDFGLFFNVTLNQGIIRETTDVIDVYVYNALMTMGDIGMSSAVGLLQSLVGFFMVLTTNYITGKFNSENRLF